MSEAFENLVNYTKIIEARMNPPERIYHPELTESKLQRIIKALEIAQRTTDKNVEENGFLLTQAQRVEQLKQASMYQDLSKELQLLEHDSL